MMPFIPIVLIAAGAALIARKMTTGKGEYGGPAVLVVTGGVWLAAHLGALGDYFKAGLDQVTERVRDLITATARALADAAGWAWDKLAYLVTNIADVVSGLFGGSLGLGGGASQGNGAGVSAGVEGGALGGRGSASGEVPAGATLDGGGGGGSIRPPGPTPLPPAGDPAEQADVDWGAFDALPWSDAQEDGGQFDEGGDSGLDPEGQQISEVVIAVIGDGVYVGDEGPYTAEQVCGWLQANKQYILSSYLAYAEDANQDILARMRQCVLSLGYSFVDPLAA